MPGYQINWDMKTGRNAMGLLQANGNELVKAMQNVSAANNQIGSTSTNALGSGGTNQGNDKFAREMVATHSRIKELDESSKNVENGRKLVESVKDMVQKSGTGVLATVERMQKIWQSMTETGRQLQNADLKKIVQIRDGIAHVLEDFSQLRHNGTSVFSKKVGVNQGQMEGVRTNSQGMTGSMYSGNDRGLYIDFVPSYSNLRQNLEYIRENITSYDEKGAVTGRFRNAVLVCKRIVSQCDSYSEKFSNVGNELFYAKKRSIANRDEKIRNRQNELSVEAVVNILDGGQYTRTNFQIG